MHRIARLFTSTARALQAVREIPPGAKATRIPSYEYPLFAFETEPGARAVAFLGPNEIGAKRVKAEGIVGWLKSGSDTITPETFVPNDDFAPLLQSVLRENVDKDQELQAMAMFYAMQTKQPGFMAVPDMRNPPPSGRVPYPEDSLGFVEYDKDGVIVPGKYEAGPVHRLVTEHGLFVLSSDLHKKLEVAIKQNTLE